MSNITQLRWNRVDLKNSQAWIHADESKTRKAVGVPLNGDAINVLLKQKGEHHEFVFTYNGRLIKNANVNAYKKAVKRAGLGDFTFHDLRHTWATRHIMSGTPLYALQELGGWSSDKTVRKYAHLSVQYLQSHANNVSKIGTRVFTIKKGFARAS